MEALTNNISKDEAKLEPCRLAVKALLHSVPFMQANFQVEEERNFIMGKVIDEALGANNVQIRETAM